MDIYIEIDDDNWTSFDRNDLNPLELYPEQNFIILDIKNLMREEKLKRINNERT